MGALDSRQSQLLASIYDAALDQSLWAGVAEQIAHFVGSHQSLLIMASPKSMLPGDVVSFGLDSNIHRHYEEIIGEDIWLEGMKRLPAGSTCVGTQFIETQALLKTQMYHELCRPADVMYLAGGVAINDGENFLCLGCQTSEKVGPLKVEKLRTIRPILQHIERAMFLHWRINETEGENRALRSTLGRSKFGVVFLDQDRRVLWCNSAAETIFARRDGISTDHGLFRLSDIEANSTLTKMLGNMAFLGPSDDVMEDIFLRPRRAESSIPYHLTACVVPDSRRIVDKRLLVSIFIFDPDRPPAVPQKALMFFYGLTPAEVSICAGLLKGQAVAEVCDQLKITKNTIRTHLKSIFRKCEVSSQAQLILKLANSNLLG